MGVPIAPGQGAWSYQGQAIDVLKSNGAEVLDASRKGTCMMTLDEFILKQKPTDGAAEDGGAATTPRADQSGSDADTAAHSGSEQASFVCNRSKHMCQPMVVCVCWEHTSVGWCGARRICELMLGDGDDDC